MAESNIRVVVLESDFAGLSAVGFPLALSFQLQQNALRLSEAMWTAKSTDSGFSISFFWPRGNSQQQGVKKRRRRKSKVRSKLGGVNEQSGNRVDVATMTNSEDAPSNAHHVGPEQSSVTEDAPSNAHHVGPEQSSVTPVKDSIDFIGDAGSNSQVCTPQQDEQSKPLSLNLCSNVQYDKRGEVHGVTYCTEEGEEGWTPVRGRRRVKRTIPLHLVRRRAPPHVKSTLVSSSDSETDSDSSGASLTIPDHATVNFSIVDGKPGLHVCTRSTRSWTPIAARTRAKLKS